MIKITFLGTGSMVPTPKRNHTAILLSYGSENILVDCGEGTQKQLRLAKIAPTKITKILITHWHGDHVLGLPGLIQTLGANEYNKVLDIYGPKGSREFMTNMFKGFVNEFRIKMRINEIKEGIFIKNQQYSIEAKELDHSSPCLGYSFIEAEKRNVNVNYTKKFGLTRHPILRELQQGKNITWKGHRITADEATIVRKGKKITFILDTAYTKDAVKLAKDSDILICEATHLDELKEKTEEYKHLTSKQAAQIAKEAGVRKLVITHFSQRYKDTRKLEKEAKEIFKETVAAKDLMEITP
ncbi:MAG: ribonuclease Z [Candidatus Nanoarchaeia archaeon]